MHAMNKTLIATLLAVTSGSALAANPVDLKLIGTIYLEATKSSINGDRESTNDYF